ncbi:hypothetical protein [Chryseobacterium sp. 3008163]|uniref:hypothetical protein n=1 Tax=Chryseobacterium sp. 3008163 TaxID=2478663 RepID=UPI000F0CB640|nr:hypothetical protein [Chryseobacterium sp. 3008163]AYN00243.1 hypothetical protein EAG08_07815 [Chryseobacterium sp. 3008163]
MEKYFDELFSLIFKFDKLQFNFKDIQYTNELIKENILTQEGNLLNVNLETDLLFEYLISYAENILNMPLPQEISDSLLFHENFHNEIKRLNNAPFSNSYHAIIDNLGAFILVKRNRDGKDITEFLLNLNDEIRQTNRHLYSYEKHYYNALVKLNVDLELVSDAIQYSLNDEIHRHYSKTYCKKISVKNPVFANKLVEYWSNEKFDLSFKYLQKDILVNLYRQDKKAFKRAFKVFKNSPKILIDFLVEIDYQNDDDLQIAIRAVENIESDGNFYGSEIVQFYAKLLEVKPDSLEIINKVFDKFYEYYEKEDEEIRGWIVHIISRGIDGFEDERYNFLHHILNKTGNIRVIKYFFENFKEPKYYFHFFEFAYTKLEFRTNLSLFEGGIKHFWKSNKSETEEFILKFLSNENIKKRIGGIHLILMGVFAIDVLHIDSEIGQLRSIEAFERFPHSIDKIVPLLLQFRSSKYKAVKEECKLTLSRLIFEAYHEHIYKIILNHLSNSKADKSLKEFFTKTLDSYNEMCVFKSKINDLSPNQNEYNLMELYYRLEHENQAKMMEEVKEGKGTFLEHLGKTSVIVRGNAWKLDGQDEIRKLDSHQHSILVDGRIYKNPDLYEHLLNSNKSKYDN